LLLNWTMSPFFDTYNDWWPTMPCCKMFHRRRVSTIVPSNSNTCRWVFRGIILKEWAFGIGFTQQLFFSFYWQHFDNRLFFLQEVYYYHFHSLLFYQMLWAHRAQFINFSCKWIWYPAEWIDICYYFEGLLVWVKDRMT
jgi:hypothetical protein